jgi:hypothetical protein
LRRNSTPLQADQLTIYYPTQQVFYLNNDGAWQAAGGPLATAVIPVGHGVLIARTSGSSSDGASNAVLVGQAFGNYTGPVTIPANGWSFLCLPEDLSNRVWNLIGHGSNTNKLSADRMWFYSPAYGYKQLRLWADANVGWQFEPRTAVNPTNDPRWAYLQAGVGFFYTNSGAQFNWNP